MKSLKFKWETPSICYVSYFDNIDIGEIYADDEGIFVFDPYVLSCNWTSWMLEDLAAFLNDKNSTIHIQGYLDESNVSLRAIS